MESLIYVVSSLEKTYILIAVFHMKFWFRALWLHEIQVLYIIFLCRGISNFIFCIIFLFHCCLKRVKFYINVMIIHGNDIHLIFLLYVCHSHNGITCWVGNISWNSIFFHFGMQLVEVKVKYKLFAIYIALLFYVIFVLVWLCNFVDGLEAKKERTKIHLCVKNEFVKR